MNYTTGRNEAWKAKNIYDLAGNVWEWTVECNSLAEFRVLRGGSYIFSATDCCVSCRFGNTGPSYTNVDCGFRVALYIK